jgi:hypothetical protein
MHATAASIFPASLGTYHPKCFKELIRISSAASSPDMSSREREKTRQPWPSLQGKRCALV